MRPEKLNINKKVAFCVSCLSVFVLLIFILAFDKTSYSKYDAVEFLQQGFELRIKADICTLNLFSTNRAKQLW